MGRRYLPVSGIQREFDESSGRLLRVVDAQKEPFLVNGLASRSAYWSVIDFGATGDGSTNDTAAVQAAIDYAEAAGGGVVYFPQGTYLISSTLTIDGHGVSLLGAGEGMNYGTVESVTVTTPATKLLWGGGASPFVHFTCVAGQYKKVGGGVEKLFIHCGDGAGVATYGILVTSRDKLTVRNVQIFNPTEAGVRTECYSGVLGAAGSGYDVQHCMFENVNHAIDNTSNLTGRGLWLTGGQGNGGAGQGDTSCNVFFNTRWQSAADADCVRIENTDNNYFYWLRCNGGAGTGWALFLGCEDDDSGPNPAQARYNHFYGVEAVQGVVARASQTGGASSRNNAIFGLSLSNGSANATIETGSGGSDDASLVCHYSDGMFAPSTMRFPNNGNLDFTKKSDALADSRTVTWSKLNLYEDGNLAAGSVKISGTSTAGAGTYSVHTGYYTRVGRLCFVVMELTWSAHTGTGNILIEGLPFNALNTPRDVLLEVAASNLTFGGAYLAAYLIANTKTMALKTIASGAAAAAVPMDTTGTLNISGCYLIET